MKSGDTPTSIANKCQAQGVKVTAEQILKANPRVKANSLRVGMELFIPRPQ